MYAYIIHCIFYMYLFIYSSIGCLKQLSTQCVIIWYAISLEISYPLQQNKASEASYIYSYYNLWFSHMFILVRILGENISHKYFKWMNFCSDSTSWTTNFEILCGLFFAVESRKITDFM